MADIKYKRKGVTYWTQDEVLVSGKGNYRDYLGDSLREIRKAKKISMRRIPGVSISHLSEVERGLKEPSSEVIQAMCSGMDVKMSEVLRMTAEKLEKIGK